MSSRPPLRIPFHRPSLGEEEARAVAATVRGGTLMGNGPAGQRVEKALAARLGARHVFLAPSCTQAFELALLALGIGRGDEVVVPSFGFVSMANAVLLRGARPVFAEIDERTGTIDPRDVAHRLTERTRAIVPVHYAGVSCDMDDLLSLARERRLEVLEDAAQAVGARWKGRVLGTLGRAGCLSFHETKNLIAGEGGALVTGDDALARRVEVLREKGTDRTAFLRGEVDRYTWVDVGGSYVLSDLCAAVLEAQLAREDAIQSRRRSLYERYAAGLADLARRGLVRLPWIPPACTSNHHIFWLRTRTPEERDRLLASLRERGIGAAFHFVPLHDAPYARRHLGGRPGLLPVTERFAATLVRLPLYPDLPDEDCDAVIEAVREILGTGAPVG